MIFFMKFWTEQGLFLMMSFKMRSSYFSETCSVQDVISYLWEGGVRLRVKDSHHKPTDPENDPLFQDKQSGRIENGLERHRGSNLCDWSEGHFVVAPFLRFDWSDNKTRRSQSRAHPGSRKKVR